MCIHNMLHVSESIFQTGPCCMTWQYPIERFNQAIYEQIFPKIPPKIHDEHLAYTGNNHFLSTQHRLTESELRKIKHHFSTTSDVSGLQLRTKNGHYIGSKWIRWNKDWSRINYTVLVKIEVDIYANYPSRPSVLKIQNFYTFVKYYLLYKFEESKVMLAYIQWTSSIEENNVGVKKYNRLGSYAFISASAIDHSIGFIEIDKSFYIVDKKVNSLYSYLNDTENYNFYEFLIIHRNAIVNSPLFYEDLTLINGTWVKRFSNLANELNPKGLRAKENSKNKQDLQNYWKFVIKERGKDINTIQSKITDIVNMFYTTQGTSSQDLDSTINPSSSTSERDEANIIEDLDTSGQDDLEPPSGHSDLIHLESLNQNHNDNDSYQVQCYRRKKNYYTGPLSSHQNSNIQDSNEEEMSFGDDIRVFEVEERCQQISKGPVFEKIIKRLNKMISVKEYNQITSAMETQPWNNGWRLERQLLTSTTTGRKEKHKTIFNYIVAKIEGSNNNSGKNGIIATHLNSAKWESFIAEVFFLRAIERMIRWLRLINDGMGKSQTFCSKRQISTMKALNLESYLERYNTQETLLEIESSNIQEQIILLRKAPHLPSDILPNEQIIQTLEKK
ncbi:19248_t:CDS:10 [Gigaspora rosea]|nr:19248_t:CDS:10 [Gigaspora rosea]